MTYKTLRRSIRTTRSALVAALQSAFGQERREGGYFDEKCLNDLRTSVDRSSVWKRITFIRLLFVPLRYGASHVCVLPTFISHSFLQARLFKASYIHNLAIIDLAWLRVN